MRAGSLSFRTTTRRPSPAIGLACGRVLDVWHHARASTRAERGARTRAHASREQEHHHHAPARAARGALCSPVARSREHRPAPHAPRSRALLLALVVRVRFPDFPLDNRREQGKIRANREHEHHAPSARHHEQEHHERTRTTTTTSAPDSGRAYPRHHEPSPLSGSAMRATGEHHERERNRTCQNGRAARMAGRPDSVFANSESARELTADWDWRLGLGRWTLSKEIENRT